MPPSAWGACPTAPPAGRRGCRLLHDGRGRGDLRLPVVAGLRLRIGLGLAIATLLRIRLLRLRGRPRLNRRWRGSHARLRRCGLAARCWCCTELTQPLFELPVAVLQFLVLPGQLTELLFQPLDPHFRV